MDDIPVLVPTRWKLRRVVAMVYQILTSLGLQMHPDKTFVGRIDKGFDFLGYQLSAAGLGVAKPTLDKFVARARRLYEQERRKRQPSSPLAVYVQRWLRWVQAGIELPVHISGLNPCRKGYAINQDAPHTMRLAVFRPTQPAIRLASLPLL